MTQATILLKTLLLLGGIALVACTLSNEDTASVQYICPDGYGYLEGYGCAPLPYFYSEPTYIYPYSGLVSSMVELDGVKEVTTMATVVGSIRVAAFTAVAAAFTAAAVGAAIGEQGLCRDGRGNGRRRGNCCFSRLMTVQPAWPLREPPRK